MTHEKPRLLHGLKAICDYLSCSTESVYSMCRNGAPIRTYGNPGRRYVADADALHEWLLGKSR